MFWNKKKEEVQEVEVRYRKIVRVFWCNGERHDFKTEEGWDDFEKTVRSWRTEKYFGIKGFFYIRSSDVRAVCCFERSID